jgi:hypothetical protein
MASNSPFVSMPVSVMSHLLPHVSSPQFVVIMPSLAAMAT